MRAEAPTRAAEPRTGVLSVWVPGIPVPQGSKSIGTRRDGRAFVFERTSATLKPWREAITVLARAAHRGRPMAGAVSVSLTFRLPKPASNRDPAPFGARTGDLDKLTRACFDGLADAGVLANDSQVVDAILRKRWATKDHPAGVHIRAWEGLSE